MYNFLKKETKENLIVITSGFILKIVFLKNLKCLTWFFSITPVENNFENSVVKLSKEKNNCLKLVVIRKMFWKKYSNLFEKYFEFVAIR